FPQTVIVSALCLVGTTRIEPCDRGADGAIPVDTATVNAGPYRQLDEGGFAAHVGGTWRGADFDLYHYSGPQTGPNLSFRALVHTLPGEMLNFAALSVSSRLIQKHDIMHMTGADVAFPAGPFTVRAEVAWFVDHAYLRPVDDLLSELRIAPRLIDHVTA